MSLQAGRTAASDFLESLSKESNEQLRLQDLQKPLLAPSRERFFSGEND